MGIIVVDAACSEAWPIRRALARVSAPRDSAGAVLRGLDPELAADQVFRDLVADWIERLSARGGAPC